MKKILFIFGCLLVIIPVLSAAEKAAGVSKTAEEYYLLGKAGEDAGKYEKAVKEFDSALSVDPKMDKAVFEKANSLVKSGKTDDAITAYNDAKKLNSTEVKYMEGAGAAYRTAKKYKESLENLDAAIKYNAEYAEAWLEKSRTLQEMANTEDAHWCADKALEINPDYAGAWNQKKDLFIIDEKWAQTLPCFDKLIEAYPKKTEPLLGKADMLVKLDRYDDALDCVHAALKLKPGSIEALLRKGSLLHTLGYNFEAVDNYNLTLKKKLSKEARVEALQGKAAALTTLEKQEEADKCLKQAEQLAAKIKK